MAIYDVTWRQWTSSRKLAAVIVCIILHKSAKTTHPTKTPNSPNSHLLRSDLRPLRFSRAPSPTIPHSPDVIRICRRSYVGGRGPGGGAAAADAVGVVQGGGQGAAGGAAAAAEHGRRRVHQPAARIGSGEGGAQPARERSARWVLLFDLLLFFSSLAG